MTKVVRFFHIRPFGSTHGGSTVQVTADTDVVGQVDVQVAKCSKRDQFVKHVGRMEAAKAPVKVVPLRYLPQELGRVWEASACRDKQEIPLDFTFAIKYFLPKE